MKGIIHQSQVERSSRTIEGSVAKPGSAQLHYGENVAGWDVVVEKYWQPVLEEVANVVG